MNCDTGEFTNDPEQIRKWREAGIPVMDLPDYEAREAYETAPVTIHPDPSEESLQRLERALNNARLNQLCGKR